MQKDQHFMRDAETIRKIVVLADIGSNEKVIEIGAGRGALTKELAKSARRVIAIELDSTLKPVLEKKLGSIGNVSILIKNALKADLSADKIVGNIPYAICEPLLRKLPMYEFKKAVLTVSKSFAYRLLAKPGEKNHSELSDFAQKKFKILIEMELEKGVFEPRPGTNSVVISVYRKQ